MNDDSLCGIQAAYFIELLFEEENPAVNIKAMGELVTAQLGGIAAVFDAKEFQVFLLKDKMVKRENEEEIPVGVTVSTGSMTFAPGAVDELEQAQYRYQAIARETDPVLLLSRCRRKILLGDWMAAALPYRERCKLLYQWVCAVLPQFPTCVAVRFPKGGRLMRVEECIQDSSGDGPQFLDCGISYRLFQVSDGDNPEFVADTYGLYAIGLPDIQCHFHSLTPSEAMGKLMDIAAYLFQNGDVILDGETVPGLAEGEQWGCQHEKSIVPPFREVLDICAGDFAAGSRNK